MAWAERWHYPYVRLPGKDAIRHGREHWQALASSRDQGRKILVEQRIQLWNARAKETN